MIDKNSAMLRPFLSLYGLISSECFGNWEVRKILPKFAGKVYLPSLCLWDIRSENAALPENLTLKSKVYGQLPEFLLIYNRLLT